MTLPEPGASYEGRSFADATLAGAVLDGCQFYDCGFEGAALRQADLRETRFEQCRFYDADRERGADFAYADLREASFVRCELSLASFANARGYGLSLIGCRAQGSDFARLDCRLPIDTDPPLIELTINDCNLAYADFSQTNLRGANLRENRCIETNFDGAVLEEADLTLCELSNLSGRGLTLRGADLRGATFNNLDPRLIDLEGVIVTPEQLAMLVAPLGVKIEP